MITHTIIVRGSICPNGTDESADKVKADLIEIMKGAGVTGTHCTLTWDSHLDASNSYSATTLNMYIEKVTFTEKASDYDPGATESGIAKYDVVVTLVEGTKI